MDPSRLRKRRGSASTRTWPALARSRADTCAGSPRSTPPHRPRGDIRRARSRVLATTPELLIEHGRWWRHRLPASGNESHSPRSRSPRPAPSPRACRRPRRTPTARDGPGTSATPSSGRSLRPGDAEADNSPAGALADRPLRACCGSRRARPRPRETGGAQRGGLTRRQLGRSESSATRRLSGCGRTRSGGRSRGRATQCATRHRGGRGRYAGPTRLGRGRRARVGTCPDGVASVLPGGREPGRRGSWSPGGQEGILR
jgi:hypothetical protein